MPQAGPSFAGLLIHRDLVHRYSLLIPDGWHRLDTSGDGASGVLYVPSIEDTLTGFSAEARDLGTEVTANDLPALRDGFLQGLQQLDEPAIESFEAEAIGRLVTMEARQTFRDDGAVRKRWVRLLFQGSTQVRLVAQGASVDAYEYWLPMFFEAMRTVRFGDWWADAGGLGWAERAFELDTGDDSAKSHAKGPAVGDTAASAIAQLIERTYAAFNTKDVEAVLATLHPDVDWPDMIESRRLRGHDEVRSYWSRQFSTIDPRVEPASITIDPDGSVVVDVHQVVRDLEGTVVSDRSIRHVYTFRDGLIGRMDVRPADPEPA